MARNDISHLGARLIDKRQGRGTGANTLGTVANYDNVTALRTRLTAIDAVKYSSANLDKMTKNDMQYALRLNDDVAGVK